MEPEVPTPIDALPRPGPNWALLGFGVSVGALIVAGAAWYQSRGALAELRDARTAIAGLRSGPGGLAGDAAGAERTAPIIDLANAPTLGPPDAAVAMVEFSDYECPYCIRHFQQTMPQILANYVKTGKIRYAFRDWPVDQLHPQAIRAHEAAHCAGEQKQYWELHVRLFGPAGSHTPDRLLSLARELKLDIPAFDACIGSGRATPAIRTTSDIAVAFGATGTPAFFIGFQDKTTQKVTAVHMISGAQDYGVFVQAIEDVLGKVK